MAKKPIHPPVTVLSLDDIASLTAAEAADQFGERYSARSRVFIEMGKLIWHLENRAKLPKGQSIYGVLQSRGVPESSVNNARLVAHFITNLVQTGLVTEGRADEVLTFRIANQVHRILNKKTAAALTAAELAAIINDGDKAAIGDELDCLAEHGLTIAGKLEADDAKRAEDQRLKDLATAAAAAAQEPPAAPLPAVATPAAPVPTSTAPAGPTSSPSAGESPAESPDSTGPLVVDTTRVAGAAPATNVTPIDSRKPGRQGPTVGEILAELSAVELRSYDLDPAGLEQVRAKLAQWTALLDSTLAEVPKSPLALAS